ncbi:hypothetical protein Tco_0743203 [Tanacetum coccineum]
MLASSSSSHATVTGTTLTSPCLVYLEYLAPSDDDIILVEDQPLHASPISLSPGYIADSEPIEDGLKEDLKMDLIDYVADEQEEESFKEEEEEEHLDLTDSALFTGLHRAWKTVRPQTPLSSFIKTQIIEYASVPISPLPPPSLLSLLSSPLPKIPSLLLLLPSPTHRDIIPEADILLRKRARFIALFHRFEIEESLAAPTARQAGPALARGVDYGFIDTLDASIRATDERVMTALEGVNERMTDLAATHKHDSEEFYTHHQDAQDDRALLRARVSTLERERLYFRSMIDDGDAQTRHIQHDRETARALEHQDGHEDASSCCMADALVDYESNQSSRNGNDSHNSRSVERRHVPTSRMCTYKDFFDCQPLNFKGTEGVVGLTQWFEKMESVFHINSCTVENQVKGTDIVSYTQCLQEFALMCGRMFHEESDEVKKYLGGLPDMILGNVMFARLKTMQEAIELTKYLMDQKEMKIKDKSRIRTEDSPIFDRKYEETACSKPCSKSASLSNIHHLKYLHHPIE